MRTPEQVSQVPCIAVVWPVPLNTGPFTTRVARSGPVGYPTVEISWFEKAKLMGASMRYSVSWQSERI